MKLKTIIDPCHDEEILIYAHQRSPLIDEIEHLVNNESLELIGYKDKTATPLSIGEICCFTAENNKVYAITCRDRYEIKARLYQIEEKLTEHFIKINQSCIANIRQIKKFDATFSGTLQVIFKNDYKEYVSRRNIRKVKERLGL